MWPKGFLIIGVSCSGKSILGIALAQLLDSDFIEVDDFHSAENIAKIAAGIPLSDSDRSPWLDALNRLLLSTHKAGHHPVLAFSGRKKTYPTVGRRGWNGSYLFKGSYELIRYRLLARVAMILRKTALKSVLIARRASRSRCP